MTNVTMEGSARFPLAWGFCYWLIFLLVLEPDNALKAAHTSHALDWGQEVLRISAASLLGASATPLLLGLVRRWPVEGPAWAKRAAIEVLASAGIAAVLIVISCLLADRMLASEHRPLGVAIVQELQANWTLLTFAIGGLLAIVHAIRFINRPAVVAKPDCLTRVPVKSRGCVTFVELADVDWIEAQGNYVALHTATGVHLARQGLSELERGLEPDRFVRIHRRVIVAADRIESVKSLGAGDGLLRLKDGTDLRVSRGFRDRIAAHLR